MCQGKKRFFLLSPLPIILLLLVLLLLLLFPPLQSGRCEGRNLAQKIIDLSLNSKETENKAGVKALSYVWLGRGSAT